MSANKETILSGLKKSPSKETSLLGTENKPKAEVLLTIRANLIRKAESDIQELLKIFKEHDKYLLNKVFEDSGYRLLDYAALNHHSDSVRLLIAAGAEPDRKGLHEYTCLHLLLESKFYSNGTEKHTYKGKAANPDLKAQEAQKREAIIKLMPIKTINATDKQGKTPLHFALRHVLIDEAKWLIESGATVTNDDVDYARKQLKQLKLTKEQEDSFIKFMISKVGLVVKSQQTALEYVQVKPEISKNKTLTKPSEATISASYNGKFFSEATTECTNKNNVNKELTTSSFSQGNNRTKDLRQETIRDKISRFEQSGFGNI